MPYECRFCGGIHCSSHRLPENHDCAGLDAYEADMQSRGQIYDDRATRPAGEQGALDRLKRGIPLSSFRGNVTFVFLAIMVVTYMLQLLVIFTLGPRAHNALFTLSSAHVEYVWTWITSVFAHSPGNPAHIFINGLVLYFFGTFAERRIGSKRFAALFLVAGVVAGLAQVLVAMGDPTPARVLGASGAVMAVMGLLTVLNPNLTVYFWFVLPMPLWVLTIGFALYDLFFLGSGGAGAGGVARLAHLSGLAIGLAYGRKLKQEGLSVRDQVRFGGGGRGGRRRPPRR